MFLTLERIKKHLNIDADFTEDDNYLISLVEVAESAVQKHIDANLSDICDETGGALPAPLLHAMLLFIGDLYMNRESVGYGTAHEIPLSYNYLLSLYKNYNNTKHNS